MKQNTAIVQLAPLPWYEAETYERVCALMHDRDQLFVTYADWLAAAQRTEEQLRSKGANTIRVTLDLVLFPAWCAAHRPGLHINGEARTQYASFVSVQSYRASQASTRH